MSDVKYLCANHVGCEKDSPTCTKVVLASDHVRVVAERDNTRAKEIASYEIALTSLEKTITSQVQELELRSREIAELKESLSFVMGQDTEKLLELKTTKQISNGFELVNEELQSKLATLKRQNEKLRVALSTHADERIGMGSEFTRRVAQDALAEIEALDVYKNVDSDVYKTRKDET